jgi:hypothetical protein
MSNGTPAGGSGPSEVKVTADVPAIFADVVSSHTFGKYISKFYLARIDSDPLASGPNRATPVAQVIMPLDGFISLWVFFEHRLKLLIREGTISKSDIDQARDGMKNLPGWTDEPL